MTLNPSDDVVEQIIQSYRGYAQTLSAEKREQFDKLFSFLYEFVEAINAKGGPFPEESALLSLVLKQHIMIEELTLELVKLKEGKKKV